LISRFLIAVDNEHQAPPGVPLQPKPRDQIAAQW